MKQERDYIQDLTEIRSMMERSSKFLSLSGWAGVMAGIYALVGVYVIYSIMGFSPDTIYYSYSSLPGVIGLGLLVLSMAIGTAIILSYKKASKRGEKVWNASSRLLLANVAMPLATGGVFVLILLAKGLIGLIAPVTMLFYGLALYSASNFTYDDLKYLGLTQLVLGLLSSWFIEYGLLFWAIGFGVVHIVYGIYMHFRYER